VLAALAVAVLVGLGMWQYERRTAAKLEEMHRSSLATSRGIERGLTQQLHQLQASLDALSGRLATPIEIVVSDSDISLNRVTLSAYVRDYLRTPPTRREVMRLSLTPPELLTLLREHTTARLRDPGLTPAEEAQLRSGNEYADRLWGKMEGSVNELIARAADLIAEPESSANNRKPPSPRVSGSSQQVAFEHPDEVRRTTDKESSAERIATICQHYIRIQMYKCLHTLVTLLPEGAVADPASLPPVITREDTWESLVLLIYREKGLVGRRDNALAAVQLSGPDISATELFFPRGT